MSNEGTIRLDGALSELEISLEACLALGAQWAVGEKSIPPLCAGALVVLDSVGSPLLRPDPDNIPSLEDVRAGVAVLRGGPLAVQPAFELLSGDRAAWDAMAAAVKEVDESNWLGVIRQFGASVEYAFGGMEAIDWGDKAGTSVSTRFDMLWLGHIISAAAVTAPGETIHALTWTIPLAMVTHLAAATARQNGATIRRPLDIAAAMKMLEVA